MSKEVLLRWQYVFFNVNASNDIDQSDGAVEYTDCTSAEG